MCFLLMEAGVLNPAVRRRRRRRMLMAADAEQEVIKLQELVRKLEEQNQQLRRCAAGGAPLPHTSSCSSSSSAQSHPDPASYSAAEEEPLFSYFQPSSVSAEEEEEEEDEEEDAEEEDEEAGGADAGADAGGAATSTVLEEVEMLDLNAVLPVADADTWLYVSARGQFQGEAVLSPLQWCRRVLDHPGPEVELAKLTLCHRLEQAKRWRISPSVRPYSCIEGLSSLSLSILPYPKPAALSEPTVPLAPPGPPVTLQTLPARPVSALSDRTPTFLSNSAFHSAGRRHAAISPQSSLDSEAGVAELDDDSISMSYKLQDMTDVQVMARLQEESLRQDYASTSTSATISRRSSSFSINSLRRSEMDLEEEDEDDEDEGYDQLPPPQPRLFRTSSMQQRGGLPHSHTFSSIRDCRRSPSSPSQFPLGGLSQYSQYSQSPSLAGDSSLGYRSSATEKLRRSMPSLLRSPSMASMASVPSLPSLLSPLGPPPGLPTGPPTGPSSLPMMSSLRSSQSFDSSSGLARLQSSIPSPGQLSQRVQSVGNFSNMSRPPLKATAYVSPTVQQGPPPSSTSSSSSTPTTMSSSLSLQSFPSSGTAGPVQPLKPGGTNPLKGAAHPRTSLPRPASFVGTGGMFRPSKIAQPTRSLLAPPKSMAALSALRDGSWKDGCY